MQEDNPLVSVCVITYNSSEFVLETLESVKAQTYQNIELIVSDDGSTDNTVDICETWVNENSENFIRTEIITVEKNTGVPANCNRAVRAIRGEWVKLIAGDDILYNECVEVLIEKAASVCNDVGIIGGVVQPFCVNKSGRVFAKISPWDASLKVKIGEVHSAEKQYQMCLRYNIISAPTVLTRKDVYKYIQYNEKYRLLEDYPFFLDMMRFGYKYEHLNEVLVYYRLNENSILHTNSKSLAVYYDTVHAFNKDYRYPELPLIWRWFLSYEYFIRKKIYTKRSNCNKLFFKIIYVVSVKLDAMMRQCLLWLYAVSHR
jgi:alpha-1,3-rhamnosyltransferase